MTSNHHTPVTTGAAANAATINSPLSELDAAITNIIAGSEPVDLLNFEGATELTISGGAITVTQSYHTVDTESDAASDNLDTINGGAEGDFLILRAANTARTVVIRDGQDNIYNSNDANITLDDTEKIAILICDGTNWVGIGATIPFTAAQGGTGQSSYTKGDMLVASAATTLTKLGVGTNGYVHVADSGETTGTKWANVGVDASTTWGGNLIRNYPSLEKADGALPDWWAASNDATLTEEDATGESIAQKHERVLKLVVSADGGGADWAYQSFAATTEASLDDNVTKISAGAWVYTANAGTITLQLYDVDGTTSLGTSTTTTTSAWVFLSVENVTYQDSTQIRIYHSANSATVYIAMPMLNVGARVLYWRPRGIRRIDHQVNSGIVDAVDPGAVAWTDLDMTAHTSPLCVLCEFAGAYSNDTTVTSRARVRRNGSSTNGSASIMAYATTIGAIYFGYLVVQCDAGQVVEYGSAGAFAVDTEAIYMYLAAYWEWA